MSRGAADHNQGGQEEFPLSRAASHWDLLVELDATHEWRVSGEPARVAHFEKTEWSGLCRYVELRLEAGARALTITRLGGPNA